MIFKLCIFCLFILEVIAESCVTPNYEEAECVSLYNCKSLLRVVETQAEFVSKSSCGSGKEPKVCCGTSTSFKYDVPLSDLKYCGLQHSDDYHVQENVLGINEFPWLALLLYRGVANPTQHVIGCGGSLMNTRYVLTAAQCLSIPDLELKIVRLGETNTETDRDCVEDKQYPECSEFVEYGIEEKIHHPDFSPTTGIHDIALIKLNRKILFWTDFIRPICLPIFGINTARAGETLMTSGWGRKTHNGEMATVKKKISTKLLSNKECRQSYKNGRQPVTENHICTKDLETNTEFSCSGDAGAPVIFHNSIQWHIEGIASWGKTCGENFPEVHTKVSKYLGWIANNIQYKDL